MTTPPTFRPTYHYSCPKGWINDPNGFSYYQGNYHLFAQHNPHQSQWGPMHWAHGVSQDLISWTHLPIALTPDQPYEHALGCFSGTAITHQDNHVLMYTACQGEEEAHQIQHQCLALGDGKTYQKSPHNPVISTQDLPPFVAPGQVRDPKLFQREDGFYCLLGAQLSAQPLGTLLLYRSQDLQSWDYVGEVFRGPTDGSLGTMFECPDLFSLDGKDVILTSPIAMPPQGTDFQNRSSTLALVGKMDWNTATFTPEFQQPLDGGFDFYAPQTLENPENQRILIAWAEMWDRVFPTHQLGLGWAGTMTLPRILTLEENRLKQRPIQGIMDYFSTLCPLHQGNQREYRLSLTLKIPQNTQEVATLSLLQTAAGGLDIRLDFSTQQLTVDRSRTAYPLDSPQDNQGRSISFQGESHLSLDVFVDHSLVEIFVNQGTWVLTSHYYPGEGEPSTQFSCTLPHQLEKWVP